MRSRAATRGEGASRDRPVVALHADQSLRPERDQDGVHRRRDDQDSRDGERSTAEQHDCDRRNNVDRAHRQVDRREGTRPVEDEEYLAPAAEPGCDDAR